MGTFTSGLGAHLTWTLPFGLLVMFAIFNRFDNRYEEAARDQGATPAQTLRYVILPIILPSVIGVGFFGFTLSWDEIARSSQAMGEHNTLPMELQALTTTVTTPEIYALGTSTTGVSFAVIALALIASQLSAPARLDTGPTPARREAGWRPIGAAGGPTGSFATSCRLGPFPARPAARQGLANRTQTARLAGAAQLGGSNSC